MVSHTPRHVLPLSAVIDCYEPKRSSRLHNVMFLARACRKFLSGDWTVKDSWEGRMCVIVSGDSPDTPVVSPGAALVRR